MKPLRNSKPLPVRSAAFAAMALALAAVFASISVSAENTSTMESITDQHDHVRNSDEVVIRLRIENGSLLLEAEGLSTEEIADVRFGLLTLPLAVGSNTTSDGITVSNGRGDAILWTIPLGSLRAMSTATKWLSIMLRDGTMHEQAFEVDTTSQQGSRLALDSSKASCPWLIVEAPSKNAIVCTFGTKKCFDTTKQHTGIDYSGKGDSAVRLAADGRVVAIEYSFQKSGSSDHGMGTSLIVEHQTSSCSAIYSLYAHLEAIQGDAKRINARVVRGTTIGTMGGSGYGKPNKWSKHLHFEMKTSPITGNPLKGIDCKTPNSCWGYTVDNPSKYGYVDPADWIRK